MLLTEQQAADAAQVSVWTIRRLIKAGRLDTVDLGSKTKPLVRIPAEALDRIRPKAPPPTLLRGRRRRSASSVMSSFLPPA